MIVAGIMSGTSADGINVALVRVSASARLPALRLIGHTESPYPPRVRRAVLAAMNAPAASVADLARLNFLLGELYADAVLKAQRRFRVRAQLIGCHGQTVYHQGRPAPFLSHNVACTWQTGESALVAARLGVPVVSDFRPADMAAGGRGAPLVPFLDFMLYRHPRWGRIVQNIGGIANLTAIPAAASPSAISAFDTGPGNMVIDAVCEKFFSRPYDRNGEIAAQGRVLAPVVLETLRASFFRQPPPRTAGREEFGREFLARFLKRCRGASPQDIVSTATALTAESIAHAIRRFVLKPSRSYRELIVSGGGSRNSTLMAMLINQLAPLGIQLRFTDEFGLPSESKEAVAFAVLAFQSWQRRPGNIPAATGARRPAILGKIAFP